MNNTEIDLSRCRRGARLLSQHGIILTYIKPLSDNHYDHMVEYPNGTRGTRTNDGFVCRNLKARLTTDHNVVKILENGK